MDDEVLSVGNCVLLPHTPKLAKGSTKMTSEEYSVFSVDEVSNIIKEVIERLIGNHAYQHDQVTRWTADIVDQILTELTNLGKRFKYIVQAVIVPKNGTGLHAASSCYWNDITDGSCTLRWENKYIHAVVSVFGLSI
ncbi:unnamed protein product [Rotaria magnacalcarata]|uniref:Dynein light chain Tctex-type 1 n=3 Tax=Rotaria magnacalcarata TaxID=392030 RepID=A0A817AFZ0_9BILA|nr:unnamed protein product [Rotaria magnacalcarata]CAF2258527.1 unnamed protein product [Rotaria magnacalcarata]CAF3795847.1 unnamed protein product [Rotaria magnacalcarata]CAF3959560.1 unnamed protein product [Rotaria magnacalcarata]